MKWPQNFSENCPPETAQSISRTNQEPWKNFEIVNIISPDQK
jgi:hypothetical protein